MKRTNYKYSIILGLALFLAACAGSDGIGGTTEVPGEQPLPVTFEPTYGEMEAVSRAGTVGPVNDMNDLRSRFIGVYAYYTGNSNWATASASTIPNFMYNEQLSYVPVGTDGLGNDLYAWTYEPIKYWPNDNNPADNAGAIGSQTHNYLSFFAYAPYVGNGDGTMTSPAVASASESGIVGQTANTATGAPKITYNWTDEVANQVDLLWATNQNCYKYDVNDANDDGRTSDKVLLNFRHALAAIDVYVRRVYDETSVTDRHPDNDTDTKIFVSEVKLTPATAMVIKGELQLSDGVWTNTTNQPAAKAVAIDENSMPDKVRGTKSEAANYIRIYELDKWSMTDAGGSPVTSGVTEEETRLFSTNQLMMLIPQTRTFTPQITYSYITRDNDLELGYITDTAGNRYSRIVNTVTGTAINDFELQAGKKYKLLCLIGVEHVSFEIVEVEEWDFPMRYTPDVVTPTDGEIEKTVNEE